MIRKALVGITGVLFAIVLPLSTASLATATLSVNQAQTVAPVNIPGLLSALPPPVIPLPDTKAIGEFQLRPSTAHTISLPPYALARSGQAPITLVPGVSNIKPISLEQIDSGQIRHLTLGVTGNIGTLGIATVTLYACLSTPWRSASSAMTHICSNLASSPTATLAELTTAPIALSISGFGRSGNIVTLLVKVLLPTSASNVQENQDVQVTLHFGTLS